MNGIDKLLEMLNEDITSHDEQSTRHKKIYRVGQATVITLTAVTTMVAGAGLIFPNRDNVLQFSVLSLTAATTAVAAWLEMRRVRELWQHEREMYYALIDIRREINFYNAHRQLTPAEVEAYFQRVSAVLGSSMHKWARILEKKNP
jgi:hypothetical protein